MAFLDPSNIPSAEEVNQGHTNSDVDKSRLSQHHTLGTSATQASPGNHNHDGISSVKIKATNLEGGTTGYYGAFSSFTDQTAANTTTAYPMIFEQTDEANGVTIALNGSSQKTRITFANTGTYNVQWSGQFESTDTSIHDVTVWLRKNGVDVAGSAGLVAVLNSHGGVYGHALPAWNYVLSVAANDYLEFYWSTTSTNISIQHYIAGTSPTRPVTAALILTVQQVMNLGGAGATPTGLAGGDLTGTYPNPTIAAGVIVDADVNASAAIAQSKISGLVSDLAGKASLTSANAFTVGGHTITNAADIVPLSIIPFAGQSSSVFRVRNSANTADLMTLTPSGDGKLGAIALGGGTIYGSSSFLNIASTGAGQIGAIIKASSTQATDHLQYQSSAGTVLGGRNAVGQIYTGSTAPINYQVGGTPTATSGSGSVATITLTSASNLAVGDLIGVTGFTPSAYNVTGYAAVTAVSNTSPFTVSYTSTATGAMTVAGQIQTTPQATITARNAATIPLIVKGNAYNADMQRWLYPTGTVAVSLNAYGSLTSFVSANSFNSDNGNNYILRTKATADQRGNQYEATNSSTTAIAGINAVGQLFSGSSTPILTASGGTIQSIATGANPLITMASAHGFTVGDLVTLAGTTGGTYNGNFLVATTPLTTTFTITSTLTAGQAAAGGTVSAPAQKSITSRSAGTIGAVIRGAASQTANLQEWQNSGGTILANVSATGAITTSAGIRTLAIQGTGDGLSAITTSSNRNLQLFSTTTSIGGGAGVLGIANATTVPTTNPTGGGVLFVDTGALKYRGTSGTAATIVNADGTMAGGSFTGGTLTSDLVLAAGSGTVEPLTFQTNSATPVVTSGAMDYDGVVFYQVANTTPGRALATQNYEYLLTASHFPDYSVSGTAQSILTNPGVGITLVAGTTYEWELYVPYRYQSFGDTTTFLSVGWNTSTVSGTPTVALAEYLEYSSNTTSLATASTFSSLFKTTGTTLLTTSPGATGSRYGIWRSKGTIRITGTGSIKFYPTLTASAATVNVITINNGTFFKLTPLGNGTVTTIGAWA